MIKNHNLEELINNKVTIDNKIHNKELYGEVITPFSFINKILDIIPEQTFRNPLFKWLDPWAGT